MKVALALGNTDWEAEFISVLSHPMLNLKVVRRCVDGIDLLAAVKVHEIDVVVVSDATLRIDVSEVAHLHEANVLIVAISNSVQHWNGLGVENIIRFDNLDLFTVASQLAKVGTKTESPELPEFSANHKLVCVASFGGGVGRSLVAKELGWWNSMRGATTVLIEGDTYGASVLQELNLPVLSRDLLHLSQLKVAPEQDKYDLSQLAVVEPNLVVVPGLSHNSHWPALRRAQLDRMWKLLCASGDVIADLGPVFCSPENDDHQVNFINRDTVAQSSIASAKVIVFCANANSVSVTRLIRGLIDSQEALRNHEIYVVLNRIRNLKDASEMSQLVRRHTGIEQIVCLPDDPDAVALAEIKCDFLGKLQPRLQISCQLRALSHELFETQQHSTTQTQEQRLQRATAA